MKIQLSILLMAIFVANSYGARVFGNRPRFQRQQEPSFNGYNYDKPSIPFNYEPIPPQVPEGVPEEPQPVPEVVETSTPVLETETSTLSELPEEQNAPQEQENLPDINQRYPAINFFPITFGGFGQGQGQGQGQRSDDLEGGFPFGTIAIANSFSTGRGGVSNSQATAFGDARSYRNRNTENKASEDRGKSLFN